MKSSTFKPGLTYIVYTLICYTISRFFSISYVYKATEGTFMVAYCVSNIFRCSEKMLGNIYKILGNFVGKTISSPGTFHGQPFIVV